MTLNIVKKDIHNYLIKNNWGSGNSILLFSENIKDNIVINPGYFICDASIRSGKRQVIIQNWSENIEKYDKHLLEFIGPILRKHKVKQI